MDFHVYHPNEARRKEAYERDEQRMTNTVQPPQALVMHDNTKNIHVLAFTNSSLRLYGVPEETNFFGKDPVSDLF